MTKSIKIAKFDPEKNSQDWDCFISNEAVNATFIHTRRYIEYHKDRFNDCSLVTTVDNKIIAVVPAVKDKTTVISHSGLTFGGILISKKCRHNDISSIISLIQSFFKSQGVNQLVMTLPPYIYQTNLADDIPYLLSCAGATLSRRRLLSVINLSNQSKFSTLRSRGIKKAINKDLKVGISSDIKTFYTILTENLATRYGAKPVHTLQELELLTSIFPDNIKLYMTFDSKKAIAGSLVYIGPTVYKTQYITSTPEGRKLGAVDLLLSTIIEDARKQDGLYVDLGSSEYAPNEINSNLLSQKEGFGARGVCLDTYTLNL